MIPRSILKEPYQNYADSPTIKSYTLWKLYDDYFEKLVKGEITVGGRYGADPRILRGYDFVYDGEQVISLTNMRIEEVRPLGIVNPYRDKITKIHYLILGEKAYKTNLDNRYVKALLLTPKNKSIVPQHMVVEANGSSRLDIDIFSDNSESYRSLILEVHVKENSDLDMFVNLHDTRKAPSNIELAFRLEDHARLRLIYLVRQGLMTRLTVSSFLDGEYSEAFIRGISVGTTSTRLDNAINLVSLGRNTYAYSLFTGLGLDDAVIAQRGIGRITENAYGSGVEYYSEALMLSEASKAYLQPKLEIDTGNVKIAKHAARNIHILPEQVFYLETRGFSRMEAEKLLITGYLLKNIHDWELYEKTMKFLKSLLDEELKNIRG